MLTGLVLAWRALWWRRGLSVAVLAVSTVVVAVAVVGPTYDAAAKESVLQDALRSAPPLETGFEVTDVGPASPLQAKVAANLAAAHAVLYGSPIVAREAPYLGPLNCSRAVTGVTNPCLVPVTGLVVARDGVPEHVTLTTGRIPRGKDEVIVSAELLAATQLRLGDRISPTGATVGVKAGKLNTAYSYTPQTARFDALTVVGAYRTDPSAGYWFQRPYFDAPGAGAAGNGPPDQGGPPYEDAIFTVPATFSSTPYESVVDVPLNVRDVRVASTARLRTAAEGIASSFGSLYVATQLPQVLGQASANEHALETPIVLIVLQLLLLCGLVLFGAVRSAADARGPEIALARLRRFPTSSVLVFGLAEPLFLVPLALPLGLALGWGVTLALSASQLLSGTPVVLPWLAVAAGAVAVVAAGIATVGIGVRIATRPPADQWRRAVHRPRGRPWWVDAAVLFLAGGGLGWLAATGGLDPSTNTSSASSVSLAAPALLALAVAMIGSRLLPWTCRRLFTRTESRGLAGFLAVRQIARRPTTLAVTVLLAVALALATFAISAYTVAKDNRHDVAATEVGAAEVVQVQPPAGSDLGVLVDQADPSGRQAMAVIESPLFSGDRRALIGVQPARLAAVATWRSDFAGGTSLTQVARALTVPGLHPVTVTGLQLAIDASVSGLTGGSVLRLSATVLVSGTSFQLTGAPLPTTGTVRSVLTLPGCAQGCRLAGIGISRDDPLTTDLSGELVVNSLQQKGSGGWANIPGALDGGARGWRAANPDGVGYSSTLSGTERLDYHFHLPYYETPELSPYAAPATLPVAATQYGSSGTTLQAGGLDGQPLPVRVVVDARYLPRAQVSGFLVDRELAIQSAIDTVGAEEQVWLAKDADPAILQRLRSYGVALGQVQTTSATEAALSRQGPPLALALFRIGAVVAAILALAGTALTLALAARRRGFELAALLAQGVTRRALFRSVAAEQGVLLGYGTLLGIGMGLLGAVLALPSVPEFVTPPLAPRLLFAPPYLLVVGITVIIAILIAVGSWIGSAGLVRSVDPERLREYAP